jgi:hypothetical protein
MLAGKSASVYSCGVAYWKSAVSVQNAAMFLKFGA